MAKEPKEPEGEEKEEGGSEDWKEPFRKLSEKVDQLLSKEDEKGTPQRVKVPEIPEPTREEPEQDELEEAEEPEQNEPGKKKKRSFLDWLL